MTKRAKPTVEEFNARARGHFPAYLGLEATHIGERTVDMQLTVRPELLAPNNFLHAGAVVTLADTAAGFGCLANLPEGADSFTTIELKSNFLGTARDGVLRCQARLVHGGRMTQIWDATVSHVASATHTEAAQAAKTIALFRCTQMILYTRPA